MEKKIGDMTLSEIADICNKCDNNKIEYCPFLQVVLIECGFEFDKDRRCGLDDVIEIKEVFK